MPLECHGVSFIPPYPYAKANLRREHILGHQSGAKYHSDGIDRSIELLVDMGKVLTLKLEGAVVSANNAFQDALVTTGCRNHEVEFTHTLLQINISLREALENRSCVPGTA